MKILSNSFKNIGILPVLIATAMLLLALAPFGKATSQVSEMWQNVEERSLDQNARRVIVPMTYRTVRLDRSVLTGLLASAPMEFTRHPSQNPIITLPMPDGSLARFRFEQSPVVESGLSDKFPELKMTYRAQGVDDPTATSRFDWLPSGFHGIVLSPAGTILIDPYAFGNTTDYITYWKRDAANTAGDFECHFDDSQLPSLRDAGSPMPLVTSGSTLRTYRLALAATNEYCVAVGSNTVAGSLAAQVVVMNRVNGVYERDVAIHMNIVANNNLIVYAGDNNSCGGPCNSSNDPYTNGNGSTMLGQNQTTCNNVIGSANYDIGHVFSTGGGGIAGLGVVCGSSKANGVTGQSLPLGDGFSIDYVAHEMGHQFGANHTFNGTSGNCGGGNRSGSHAYEPGSGITIMAYAGICGNQDLAAHSIDTFHLDSLNAIVSFTQGGSGDSCDVPTATGNTPPTVTGPGNFNIPRDTPFVLTASATDPNGGDVITYDWQEFDLGASTTAVPNTDSDGNARPIFRCYSPTTSGTRFFPSLQYILNNANVPPSTTGSCPSASCLTGELLPAITRTMVFGVVARDNRANGGGINSTTSNVSVTSTAGPFVVTAPNTGVSIPGNTNTNVTWNVANTTAAPVSAANVKISLSTDGGNTFPTVLVASTANDGSESVLIPNTPTFGGRIKVEAVGNIFFDISDANFTITAAPTPTASPTPAPTASPTPTATPSLGITISLPVANVDISTTNFTPPVTASNISASDNLIGFQGDFTFDSAIVSFQAPPVSAAGLTSNNWNVSGNVLNSGPGTIKTVRVSAFSNDGITPLSGAGTLFNLNATRISNTPGASTPLVWAAPPNDFYFIDSNLDSQAPGSTPPGSITIVATTISISGNIDYCSNGTLPPIPGVTLTLTGSASASTSSDGSGNYTFSSLTSGGNYTVTPSRNPIAPGSAGINTVDVVAVQRHFLSIALIPPGCRLTAADVNGDTSITTVDVIAIQRFFLSLTTGIANAGKYSFNPPSRSYTAVSSDQTGQNYDALVFGDVASSFVHRPGNSSSDTGEIGDNELPATVEAVLLPEITANRTRSNFAAAVTTSTIDAKNNLVAFQGDFTFDERTVFFENEPARKAGLTAGNWNVSGNVLPGLGPIRILRISAYSTDFEPLAGDGTLFELRLRTANGTTPGPVLTWAPPPNHFVFIDSNLNIQQPASASRER